MRNTSFLNYIFTGLLLVAGVLQLQAQHADPFVDNPLDRPYGERLEWFNKGNLTPNASFEQGEGGLDQFTLKGWQRAGDQITWTDRSSFRFSAGEIYEGAHSVKIVRSRAEENDPGQGIRSDFIAVIPGNYQFTLYLKAAQLSGHMERLGTRLFDAVDLRLEYFDAQKKPLDGRARCAYLEGRIDNSFKGYSFSNLWHIDEFGWGMVIGRSYNYPFIESDIPRDARYVRIYIGLKGTGTLWVDKVDFRYSKWNFTPMERLLPYRDSVYKLADQLIPMPQELKAGDVISWYDPAKPASVPVILLPEKPAPPTIAAGQLLKSRLEANLKAALGKDWKKELVVVTAKLTDSLSRKASCIFSLGTNELTLRFSDSLPAAASLPSAQAYIIKPVQRIIFLRGNQPVGDYYAVSTLVQLLRPRSLLLESATVADYPDFEGRSVLMAAWNSPAEVKEDVANLEQMQRWKLNKVYIGYGQPNVNWHTPTDVYRNGVSATAAFCRKYDLMDLAVMVNPYYHLGYEQSVDSLPEATRILWTHGDPYAITILKNVLKPALDSGARCIMLASDDYLPHEGTSPRNYSLYTPEDKARFVNLQRAQAYVINEIYDWLKTDYPGTRMEFIPPWYLNEFIDQSRGKAEAYLSDIARMIPADVAFVWSGNTVRSLSLDEADIYRWRQLTGRNPMLWDNTLYARTAEGVYGGYPSQYPERIRLCNLFEPLDILVPESFQNMSDKRQMYVNGDTWSDLYKIKYMTVADFEWNTAAYNADLSLWNALVKTYGKDNTIRLLQFNDRYYGLKELCARLDALSGTEKALKDRGDLLVKELNAFYNELLKPLEFHKKLLSELRQLKDEQIERYKVALATFRQKSKGKA